MNTTHAITNKVRVHGFRVRPVGRPGMTNVNGNPSTRALDDEGAGLRIGQPVRQNLLVFGRIVPALQSGAVCEFEDDDALWRGAALDQLGGAAAAQELAAILCQGGS